MRKGLTFKCVETSARARSEDTQPHLGEKSEKESQLPTKPGFVTNDPCRLVSTPTKRLALCYTIAGGRKILSERKYVRIIIPSRNY